MLDYLHRLTWAAVCSGQPSSWRPKLLNHLSVPCWLANELRQLGQSCGIPRNSLITAVTQQQQQDDDSNPILPKPRRIGCGSGIPVVKSRGRHASISSSEGDDQASESIKSPSTSTRKSSSQLDSIKVRGGHKLSRLRELEKSSSSTSSSSAVRSPNPASPSGASGTASGQTVFTEVDRMYAERLSVEAQLDPHFRRIQQTLSKEMNNLQNQTIMVSTVS